MEATIRLLEGRSHTVKLAHMDYEFMLEAEKPQTIRDEKLIRYLQGRPQFAVDVAKTNAEEAEAESAEVAEDHPLPGETRRTPAKR